MSSVMTIEAEVFARPFLLTLINYFFVFSFIFSEFVLVKFYKYLQKSFNEHFTWQKSGKDRNFLVKEANNLIRRVRGQNAITTTSLLLRHFSCCSGLWQWTRLSGSSPNGPASQIAQLLTGLARCLLQNRQFFYFSSTSLTDHFFLLLFPKE